MNRKCIKQLLLILLVFSTLLSSSAFALQPSKVKVSVFNFGTANIEASGYGTTVTNMLMNFLGSESSLSLIDRRELEAFLNLNDLQQNEQFDNVISIGSRLGLNVIVIGNVEKKGSIIQVNCRLINIDQKKPVFSTQLRSFGDAGLMAEVRKLSSMIASAIANMSTEPKDDERAALGGPVNLQKRSGNMRVYLTWENSPGMVAAGYEIFRAKKESGPFAKVAQVNTREYTDLGLDRNETYFYRIRAFDDKGRNSSFSSVIAAETALTPNAPVILKVEGRVNSILLTWSPSPMAGEDPLKLKGYKLYRAKVPEGPFKEIANVLGKDLGIGVGSTISLDKLFKVSLLDKGLADGEDYYYRITAYNEKNLESDFSATIKGTTTPVVKGLSAQGDTIREIRLTWDAVESPFITGYYVYRSTAQDGSFTKIKRVGHSGAGTRKVEFIDKEGLGDQIRYFYYVTAFEEPEAETSPSVTVMAVTRGKPQKIKGLKALSGLVKRVELTWVAGTHEEIEGYKIYWSKEKVGKFDLLKKLTGRESNSFTHGGGFEKLEDNTTYYYTMTSFNKVDVESDLTETASATTKARPSRPSELKGESLKVKEVPLKWAVNPENDIVAYHILRSTSDGTEFSRVAKTGETPGYVDRGLKDGTSYRYVIQAEDKDGLISDFSDAISVLVKPLPGKPDNLTGDIKDGMANLSWKPASEPDILHYVVYEKRFLGVEKIGVVNRADFSEPAPLRGRKKTYVVTAVDKDGLESGPSSEVTITGR